MSATDASERFIRRMIIDLEHFIESERPYWDELDQLLKKFVERRNGQTIENAKRLHYLYERASSDLNKLTTFSSEPDTRAYLEALVARAYSEVHASRERDRTFRPLYWFCNTFPIAFRRHIAAFWLTLTVTMVGCVFGWYAVQLDPEAKEVLLPFGHGGMDPTERVAREEEAAAADLDPSAGSQATFSAHLMQNNIRVSFNALAFGALWGVGTIILLFYNGIIMGGIVFDYITAGQTKFLIAWLLPHGSIELPAIFIAGQAGLVLGGAVIGWGQRVSLRMRLRKIAPDLLSLIGGVCVMLIWAGIVEAYLSQKHGGDIYDIKILFGALELIALVVLLARGGRGQTEETTDI